MYQYDPEIRKRIKNYLEVNDHPILVTRENIINDIYPELRETKRPKKNKYIRGVRQSISCLIIEMGYIKHSETNNNKTFRRVQ